MFYGSLDWHNREYTPDSVKEALLAAGFTIEHFYGVQLPLQQARGRHRGSVSGGR
jgi:hypothetical protein